MAYDVRFLSQADVESLGITMREVMEHVETGWRLNGENKVELPAKIGVHPKPDCYMHAMPCWVGGDVDMAGIKWVAGFPVICRGSCHTITVFLSSMMSIPEWLRRLWTATG